MIRLAKRVLNMSPSPTLAITAKAKQMRANGIDVISFGAGEPDFDTPEFVKKAAIKAIDEGFTKYTSAAGIEELRKAVVKKLKNENNINYGVDEVVITDGAKQALFNLVMSVVEKGDEVIIPAPYWVTYPEQVKFAGGVPVFVNAKEKNGFRLRLSDIEPFITERTKLIVVCSPNNPTGAIIERDELERIGNFCVKKDILIASDECYEKIAYGGKVVSTASISDDIRSKTITINALSKTFSMTGWRVGFAAGPKEIINSMVKINSQSISNVDSISQKAAVAALKGNKDFLNVWLKTFKERRDYIIPALNNINGITCSTPEGAFYAFPNVRDVIKKGNFKGDAELAAFLLEDAKVAVVPGSAFGAPGYLRLSFATSMENIKEGIKRIKKSIEGIMS